MKSNRYTVKIDDLDREGPELSDEVLRATRGGWYTWSQQDMSTCAMGGDIDGDGPTTYGFGW